MKRFYSKSGKLVLSAICIVFALIFVISFLSCVYLGYWGLFSGSKNKFKNEMYEIAGLDYAAWILSEKDSGFTSKKLSEMNCYYGVIEGKQSDDLDYNSASSYLYKNFDGVKVPKNASIGTYGIDEYTTISLSDKFLDIAQSNSVHENYGSYDIYSRHGVQGIGYDIVGQKAYVYANSQFYPLDEAYYNYLPEDEAETTPNTNQIYSKIWASNENAQPEEDETYYVIEDEADETASEEQTKDYLPTEVINEPKLYINGVPYNPLSSVVDGFTLKIYSDDGGVGVLSLDNVADLSEIHSELAGNDNYVSLDDISSIGVYEENPDMHFYTVVCFPNETKLAENHNPKDFYVQANEFVSNASKLKYLLPLLTIIAFIVAFGSYILFVCSAGHKKDSKDIVAGPIEKIPTDLVFVGSFLLECLILATLVGFVSEVRSLETFFYVLIGSLFFIIAMVIGLAWTSNIAVNIKLHQAMKNTLLAKCFKFLRKKFGKLHEESKIICATVKWTKRIWALFIIISLIELFVILVTGADEIFLFWILEKIVFAIILRKLLKSYARIKATALELAAGNTESQVDLNGMPLFLEEHARAMNDIQSGINVALAERTKSERMKTELITNVSHDIKTPLTSIINYVDLLEKEDIENDKAKEYLEVLDRQSKRLKKLIEDLIEASKISSGNVKFNMEKVNAVVLLNQSIGEFSERLEANQISLVTSFPEKDIYLQADNRYLWRVFDNLMSNIVKYAQPNTRAYVDLQEDDNHLKFVFRNTSKEELNISAEELMERFVRGDKSRYTDGNGLGLSIAKSLTEAMGGKINLSIDGDLFKAILEFDKVE